MKFMKIDMEIVTVQPVSITLPVPDGGKENAFGNAPLMTRGIDEEGHKLKTCYIPATTIRGKIRRHAVMPAIKRRALTDKPYTLNEAYQDLIGQDKNSEKQQENIDLENLLKQRENNAFADLFGSGLGLKSRLHVSHFMPKHNLFPEAFGSARKDLADHDDGASLELMSSDAKDEYLQRANANSSKSKLEALKKAVKAKLRKEGKKFEESEELAKIDEKLAELEPLLKEMSNSSRMPLNYFALPAGVTWSGKMIVYNPKERDTEILLAAFNEFSLEPVIGAQVARGCGEIAIKASFQSDRQEQLITVSCGNFSEAVIEKHV